jgi:hypothetical protein
MKEAGGRRADTRARRRRTEIMCTRVTCSSCGKPTFAGCGAHVEAVLGSVPRDKRCKCRETSAGADGAGGVGGRDDPMAALRRLFGG